ncbi:glycosyltransferase family 4 protein [Bifidobacterium boum]|uniref:glycosyltransferase family 4 protein n=1 Tax=Bifidobacterium boum TaxID=78343 RepID=UPI003F8EA948
MKILFVSHKSDLSGANKSMLDVICHLRNEHNIYVLVNSKEGLLIDYLTELGIPYIYANYSWWYSRGSNFLVKQIYRYLQDWLKYWNNRITNKQIEEIKEKNFDCIYSNTSTIDVGALLAHKLNVSHIWHIREYGDVDFGFKRLRSSRYMEQMFSYTKRFIFISNALAESYRRRYSICNGSIIYNGFDVNALSSNNRRIQQNGCLNILVAGQVISGKGQDQAIRAVSDLYHQGMPIHLYLAGQVDESYLKPVLNDYEDSSRWLTVLGNVKDMYSLRNDMDIELVCSHSEAFGRVTLEAMLHHLPVIGARSGATPELIIDGQTGLLYRLNDIQDLEQKIRELAENPEKRIELANRAYEGARKYTIENTCNKINSVLKMYGK